MWIISAYPFDQKINQRSEDLRYEAENFASMANELVKQMERKKKWWKIWSSYTYLSTVIFLQRDLWLQGDIESLKLNSEDLNVKNIEKHKWKRCVKFTFVQTKLLYNLYTKIYFSENWCANLNSRNRTVYV